jgi:hypothetical protein
VAANVFDLTGSDFSELKDVERSKVLGSLGLVSKTSFDLTSETGGNDADEVRECFAGVDGGSSALTAGIAALT